ncbi:MAG: nucleoside-diphosphate sugar epimerase/dehydratase [Myxococcota bacterium]|jgi:FlaA1/EpsC-like NDP-sugar epimerase|nr:nucleoside-diphosphate sugar epimerase/dehydratase [Myxococcota bacterium]
MQRIANKTAQAVIDLLMLSLVFWLSFLLRFEFELSPVMLKRLVFVWPYVIAFEYVVLLAAGITRYAWRYIGLHETIRVGYAIAFASAVLLVFRFSAAAILSEYPRVHYLILPVGVISINFALAFLGVVGVRVLRRLLAERQESSSRRSASLVVSLPTLLVGAGQAGVLIAKEIASRPELGISPIGFIDDDPSKRGTVVHGIKVLGSSEELAKLAAEKGAAQVIITIANAPGSAIRRIAELCENVDIPVKIIPGIFEILGGKVNLSRIRNVSVEDLLRREAVELDIEGISKFISGKRVLVTGAGGSIGSELCRQVARFSPESLLLVERAEYFLYAIHKELHSSHPELALHPILADISDAERVEQVFARFSPDVVFHAAAHKHVPMMEYNPGEALRNNVFGTKVIAEAAARHRCDAFVMISTDKAVNPTSIMGASKRVAEMIVQSLSQTHPQTQFCAVRFGNVLGSSGSVIPLFKEQIAAGGPVTVTHPEMKRYFMTIPEAAQLVMEAAAMAETGQIFVLDMGEPVKIVDLARDLIRFSGFEPDVDIRIEFSGVRPGEKLFEELGFDGERMSKTKHPKIWIGDLATVTEAQVSEALVLLEPLCGATRREEVREALVHVVPEMQPEHGGPADKRTSSVSLETSKLKRSKSVPLVAAVPPC